MESGIKSNWELFFTGYELSVRNKEMHACIPSIIEISNKAITRF